jgi:hypothetical protein
VPSRFRPAASLSRLAGQLKMQSREYRPYFAGVLEPEMLVIGALPDWILDLKMGDWPLHILEVGEGDDQMPPWCMR